MICRTYPKVKTGRRRGQPRLLPHHAVRKAPQGGGRRVQGARAVTSTKCPVIIEGGIDANVMDTPMSDIQNRAGVNALVVYPGQFRSRASRRHCIAKKFGGPVMYVAAAEENDRRAFFRSRRRLLRHARTQLQSEAAAASRAYIPEYPVGTAEECADMIAGIRPDRPHAAGAART